MSVVHRIPVTLLLLALILTACADRVQNPSVPQSALQGTLIDSNGIPVAAATVTLFPVAAATVTLFPVAAASVSLSRTDVADSNPAPQTTVSDANGIYTFAEVNDGMYNLIVNTDDGRGSFQRSISITGTAGMTVNVEVTPLGAIAGTAVLEDSPSDSAGIDLAIPGTMLIASTANNGAFTISNVPAGTYDLVAEARNHRRVTVTDVTVSSGATTALPGPITLTSNKSAPVAAFTIVLVGNHLTVDASASRDEDGTIVNYAWDFGDGARAVGKVANHSYENEGTKTVTLTVTDNDGLTGSLSMDVEIAKTEEVPTLIVNAGDDSSASVGAVTLAPLEHILIQVQVGASVASGGAALYLELNKNLPLAVQWGGRMYYSSSADHFSLIPGLGGAAASLQPQGILVSTVCRGSCVIVESEAATAMLTITNTTNVTTTFDLFAFTEPFSDSNEPANESAAGATPLTLPSYESGAIEVIGDVDYYRVEESGSLSFDSGATFEVLAYVLSSGEPQQVLHKGESVDVVTGDYVRVEATESYAAASGNSLYFLSLEALD